MSHDDQRTPPRGQPAEIVREYGPFPDLGQIRGVTHDGHHVWFAADRGLHALDPATGALARTIEAAADAGTAFDGHHLFQIAGRRIDKLDPATGRVLASIPAPGGNGRDSGLAWADGTLWVGQHADRRIYQIDPATGEILRTIESNRFVTGVTWIDGELWHGADEAGEAAVRQAEIRQAEIRQAEIRRAEIRRIDPETGDVLDRLELPAGTRISGLESDGGELLFCGGGPSGTIRAVRRPRRASSRRA